jgi:hypothetical protein
MAGNFILKTLYCKYILTPQKLCENYGNVYEILKQKYNYLLSSHSVSVTLGF